jgi:hypothetical protein
MGYSLIDFPNSDLYRTFILVIYRLASEKSRAKLLIWEDNVRKQFPTGVEAVLRKIKPYPSASIILLPARAIRPPFLPPGPYYMNSE